MKNEVFITKICDIIKPLRDILTMDELLNRNADWKELIKAEANMKHVKNLLVKFNCWKKTGVSKYSDDGIVYNELGMLMNFILDLIDSSATRKDRIELLKNIWDELGDYYLLGEL